MPIIYVHGVANRKDDPSYQLHTSEVERLLLRYVAPMLPTTTVRTAYWGDYGAQFHWNGESRPKTVLFGQGTSVANSSEIERALALASVKSTVPLTEWSGDHSSSVLVPAGPPIAHSAKPGRLRDLSEDELSDLLATTILNEVDDVALRPSLLIAADEIATDPRSLQGLAQCRSLEDEVEFLRTRLMVAPSPTIVAQGGGGVWTSITDRINEVMSRVSNSPAFLLSNLAAEWRPGINKAVTLFFGDVFTYLATRGRASEPGEIPKIVMDAMVEAKSAAPDEPFIVVTHSMGGQIVYDLVTHFLPEAGRDLRIDFWCACASQVGLFEELKLFILHSTSYSKRTGKKVPFPNAHYLGAWWNVWDHNDPLSYTAAPIFEGVDDEAYNSGLSLVEAHGEYLLRPSFHRKFVRKLFESKKCNWRRP